MNLHYGCGTTVGPSWFNCDSSPTLRLQRLPLVGFVFGRVLKPRVPREVNYGDIVKGLQLPPDSCELMFCSHVLEHLALDDLRSALRNSYRYLQPGGCFRAVLPNLAESIREYNENPDPSAAIHLMINTNLGVQRQARTLVGRLRECLSNSRHLWMWDFKGMKTELERAGFRDVRPIQFGDSPRPEFAEVEHPDRFEWKAVALECTK